MGEQAGTTRSKEVSESCASRRFLYHPFESSRVTVSKTELFFWCSSTASVQQLPESQPQPALPKSVTNLQKPSPTASPEVSLCLACATVNVGSTKISSLTCIWAVFPTEHKHRWTKAMGPAKWKGSRARW